jgi:hypothetical protein
MILDMIQGCRYLWRSMDRWLLSKNSTTQLKDSIFGTGPVLLWRCSIPITYIKGLYLYPCPNRTPGRLRVQHLMSKLMLRRQCPSRIRHQLVPSLYRATSPRIPENFPFKSTNRPFAEWWRTADRKLLLPNPPEKIFSSRMVFHHQARPTSQFLSRTKFWC